MDFFLHYFLPFVIALTVLVFIHELGHYFPARRFGVKVEVFSIGFGPELFGFTDKHGTRWKFSIIPMGGYVRMFGDADAASSPDADGISKMSTKEKEQTLHSKTPLQRIIVSAGGPFANYLFAILAMILIFSIHGVGVIPAKVGAVKENSLATTMGIKEGDEILKLNDAHVVDFKDMREKTQAFEGNKITLTVKRGTETLHLSVNKPEGFPKPLIFGIVPAQPNYHKVSFPEAIREAFKTTYDMSVGMLQGIGQVLVGKSKAAEFGGILAIGDMAGKSAQTSAVSFIVFLAVLSVNLGLLNLLPLPMLDGGHIVFSGIEWIAGKAVPLKIQERIYLVGFVFLASLMLYVTWNDLMRYKVFQSIQKLFS